METVLVTFIILNAALSIIQVVSGKTTRAIYSLLVAMFIYVVNFI